MFKTRLISGIVLVIIALVLIITGGNVLLFSMAAISLIGMFELYRVFDIHNKLLGIIGYIAAVVYYANLFKHFIHDPFVFLIPTMMLILAVYVFGFSKYHANQVMAAFFGIFYVAVMISYVYQTRMLSLGSFLVWLIFLSSWGCDTCAYCTGKLCSKAFKTHKMAPVLSPNKTIEGAIGGVVGSVLLSLIYGNVMKNFVSIDNQVLYSMLLVAGAGALISMIGDLAASAIKRNYDVKDYGKLIPGHGGILDRFDSVFFTAPIIYYLSLYLIK